MIKTETNRIEYKEKLTDDVEREIVAFLNSEGGNLYIGVRDNGSIVGVPNPDDVQLQLKDRAINNIRPSIMGLFDILTENYSDRTVVILNLASGMEKPYCLKQKGYSESGCFIRVGSSTQPMTQLMIDKMLAGRHYPSIANMPSRHQNLEFSQLKLYYGLKNKPLNNNFARTLDFLTPDGRYNMVAFLFADNNSISVRLGKYSGKDKLDLIGREDYRDCCLITAMQKIIDRLDIENITQSRKRPMQTRLDRNLVDKAVLREVIINSFAHNDYSRLDTPIFQIYSDRFEITSFGGLVSGLTLEKFYEGVSMPRNREIMRIFKDLEFVEQLGSGIPKIVDKYGYGVIFVGDNIVQTILRFDLSMDNLKESPENSEDSQKTSKRPPENFKKTTRKLQKDHQKSPEKPLEDSKDHQKTSQKILAAVSSRPSITMKELADLLGVATATIKDHIRRLKDRGNIRRIGPDRGGHWEILE